MVLRGGSWGVWRGVEEVVVVVVVFVHLQDRNGCVTSFTRLWMQRAFGKFRVWNLNKCGLLFVCSLETRDLLDSVRKKKKKLYSQAPRALCVRFYGSLQLQRLSTSFTSSRLPAIVQFFICVSYLLWFVRLIHAHFRALGIFIHIIFKTSNKCLSLSVSLINSISQPHWVRGAFIQLYFSLPMK